MTRLTPAQREHNIAQVKSIVNRLYRASGGSLLQLLGAERLPLERVRLQEGGRPALLPEL